MNDKDFEYFNSKINKLLKNIKETYDEMIAAKVAKECARFILPISTETKIYMKGSVRSWIHYLLVRCTEDTQLEHRQIALEILQIFEMDFPNITKALVVNYPIIKKSIQIINDETI